MGAGIPVLIILLGGAVGIGLFVWLSGGVVMVERSRSVLDPAGDDRVWRDGE